MPKPVQLQNVIGRRGENVVEYCLTEYAAFGQPLFWPGFLGATWPAVDYYVELLDVRGRRPYFFVQVKATHSSLAAGATTLRIGSTKNDVDRLLRVPGPTYIFGVHEPSRRVFAKSVHRGVASKAITRIQLAHELTPANLQRLHDEVRDWWRGAGHKPTNSVFA